MIAKYCCCTIWLGVDFQSIFVFYFRVSSPRHQYSCLFCHTLQRSWSILSYDPVTSKQVSHKRRWCIHCMVGLLTLTNLGGDDNRDAIGSKLLLLSSPSPASFNRRGQSQLGFHPTSTKWLIYQPLKATPGWPHQLETMRKWLNNYISPSLSHDGLSHPTSLMMTEHCDGAVNSMQYP